jgi:hypothetical protein
VPNFQDSAFPTIDEIMQLVRSIVNDTFPGIAGVQGRVFTNDAEFTLPYLNSALRTLTRRLRNEGVTFPIEDGVVLANIPPVVTADPSVFINIGFTGTNNGTTTSVSPYLPGNCVQVYKVQQRVHGSNLPFTPMQQSQNGLASGYQNQWLGMWEWRKYAIYMNGSLQAQDIMIRYQTGQPKVNTPAADFDTTPIFILDCQDAVANLMAGQYGGARGANDAQLAKVAKDADEAIDEMAQEYIRRAQTISYQRQSYQGGGSNNDGNAGLGSTGVTS